MTRGFLVLFASLILLGNAFAQSTGDANELNGSARPSPSTQSYPIDDSVPADTTHEETKGNSDVSYTAKGVASLLGGILLVPLGLGVSTANSFPKCEERDPGEIFHSGAGICSKSGPSQSGQVVGTGLSLTGIFLIGLGFYYLCK